MKFMTELDLQEHEKKHSSKQEFLCQYCDEKFLQKKDLTEHLNKTDSDKDFKCSYCIKFFEAECILRNHVKIDHGVNPLKCPLCDEEFLWESQLNKHVASHSGKGQQESRVKSPISGILLEEGQKEARSEYMAGKSSPKALVKEEGPSQQIQNGSPTKDAYSSTLSAKIHPGSKRFECSYCNRRFTLKCSLKDHEERMHSSIEKYHCSQCDKKFKAKCDFYKHKRKT
ncbi:gastrula zinc finger protein XlCGF26.1-like [Penaeus indicus]|uniref:gastrula zinc finger protein XlCGF26.1-like n=1 Tax=Penaeus indicus TaxID=29960 RepID=UPI00300C9525